MISKTYRKRTCEGHIYIIVNRKENKEFASILINPPSKSNNCGCSYAYALQDLLTFILRQTTDEREIKLIIKAVSGHFCNAMPPNKDHCKSCVDAVAQVIKEEFIEIPK